MVGRRDRHELVGADAAALSFAIAVQGLGEATPYLGYVPTTESRLEFAAALRGNQGAFAALDPEGTADLLHTLGGKARGNLATLLLNFGWYRSELDADGNRKPIVLPLSVFGGPDVPVNGRCMFLMEKVRGEWKVNPFFVVINPPELQFEVP